MVQKIFAFFLIQVFFICTAGASFNVDSSPENIDKQVILEKVKLEKIKNGLNYRKKIDAFIEKVNDADKLVSIQKKIDTKLEKMYINFEETSDAYIILNYLSLRIEKQIQSLKDKKLNALFDTINNSSLSQKEKTNVENEILKVQKIILSKQQDLLSVIKEGLNTNLEQKGNLSMSIDASAEAIGNIEGALQLKNISSKKSGFDTDLQTEINALIKASIQGQEAINIQFSSFLNFIGKDGNFYLLLEKLNYTGIEQEKIVNFLEKLKESALKNQYIKFTDSSYNQTKELSKYLNYNKINTDVEKLLSTSLLTPYKKVGDKYYLIPTKEACNNLAAVQHTFYAYANIDCSDSQYKKLVQDFVQDGDMYITLGTDSNTLGYTMPIGELKMVYNDTEIKSALVDINEGLNALKVNYAMGNVLDISYVDSYSNINFKSTLAKDNSFLSINYTGVIEKNITSKLTYKNGKIDGSFSITEGKGKINGVIAGTIENKILKTASLKISDEGIEDYDFLVDYSLNNGSIIGKVTVDAENKSMLKINTTGTYSKDNLDLENALELGFLKDMLDSFNPEKSLETSIPKGNVNILVKKNGETNIFNLGINFTFNTNHLEFNLDSDSTVTPFTGEIKAPTKYINIGEIMPTNNDYNNYDY